MNAKNPSKHQSASALRQPLDYVFRTRSHVRVLRALNEKGGPMSTTLIARWAQLPVRTVRVVVEELERLTVIEMRGSRRTPTYTLASDNDLADAIVHLLHMEAARYHRIIETIAYEVAVLGRYLDAAWLYGSVARGEDTPDSDIDVAVLANPATSKNDQLELHMSLSARLDEVVSAYGTDASLVVINRDDVQSYEASGNLWWNNLKRDARTLLGDDPARIANIATHTQANNAPQQ